MVTMPPDEKLWNWATSIMGEGTSRRAGLQMDPLLHIVTERDELWCTGGPALRENTPRRRYCRRCVNLAREMWENLADEDDEG